MPIAIEEYANTPKSTVTNCMVYGSPGSFKTRFAGSWPAPVFLDLQDGMVSVHSIPGIKRIRVLDWMQLLAAQIELAGKHPEIATVVVDSLTDAYEMAIKASCRERGTSYPDLKDYGVASDRIKKLVVDLKNNCKSNNQHFVVIALEQTIKDDLLGRTKGVPDAGRKLGEELGALFDLYLHATVVVDPVTHKPKPSMWTVSDGIYPAKERFGCLDATEPPDFAVFAKKIGNLRAS